MFEKMKKRREEGRHRAASEVLEDAVAFYQQDKVTIEEVMQALHERGFGILLIIFSLPNCVPIPNPGFISLTGIPILYLAFQMIMGNPYPWLPRWISRRSIPRSTLAKLVSKAAPMMKKIERVMRPRLHFASTQTGEKVMGIFCVMFAISIAIPLPGTNLIPAYGIVIMCFGLMSRDGIVMLLGALVGSIGTAITYAIIVYGTKAVKATLGVLV